MTAFGERGETPQGGSDDLVSASRVRSSSRSQPAIASSIRRRASSRLCPGSAVVVVDWYGASSYAKAH